MPQLFITSWSEEGLNCTITDEGCLHQITRVLRMRVGDILFLQDGKGMLRYKVTIIRITKNTLSVKREEKIYAPKNSKNVRGIVLAMPNKFEKLELIVQKLSEIGIDKIVCRPSRRSLLKDIPAKKQLRLENIAREATEQSWGRSIPKISFSPVFPEITSSEVVLFDYHEHMQSQIISSPAYEYKRMFVDKDIRGIIGPEGGFDTTEIDAWSNILTAQIMLGDQVLRMETAAIVAGRWMTGLK